MKKLFISVSIALLGLPFVSGQESMFEVGDKVVNFGLGIGSTFYTGLNYKSTIPPLSISFEKGIVDEVLEKGVIGVGAYAGYSGYKYEYMDWGWKYTTFILGARGAFHYPILEKLDTYSGLLIGYQIVSAKEFGTLGTGINYNASGSHVTWSWFVGGRYYFAETLAAFLELGYGITYLNLGLAIRL